MAAEAGRCRGGTGDVSCRRLSRFFSKKLERIRKRVPLLRPVLRPAHLILTSSNSFRLLPSFAQTIIHRTVSSSKRDATQIAQSSTSPPLTLMVRHGQLPGGPAELPRLLLRGTCGLNHCRRERTSLGRREPSSLACFQLHVMPALRQEGARREGVAREVRHGRGDAALPAHELRLT